MLLLFLLCCCCCFIGWLNLLGQIASVSSVTFLLGNLISTMVGLGTGLNDGEAFVFTSEQVGQGRTSTVDVSAALFKQTAGAAMMSGSSITRAQDANAGK